MSKGTLEDLITFIYSGEVNVELRNLAEFQKTAEALKIKGLDGLVIKHSNSSFGHVSTPVIYNGSQYQSTQTTQAYDHHSGGEFKDAQKPAHENGDSMNWDTESDNVPNQDEINEKNVFGIETNDDYYSDDIGQQNYEQQCDDYDKNEFQENEHKTIDFKKPSAPAAKRAKRTNSKSNKVQFFSESFLVTAEYWKCAIIVVY